MEMQPKENSSLVSERTLRRNFLMKIIRMKASSFFHKIQKIRIGVLYYARYTSRWPSQRHITTARVSIDFKHIRLELTYLLSDTFTNQLHKKLQVLVYVVCTPRKILVYNTNSYSANHSCSHSSLTSTHNLSPSHPSTAASTTNSAPYNGHC